MIDGDGDGDTMIPKGEFRHPFSPRERRRAVVDELRTHHEWSDRRLEVKLGVSRELIGKVRKGLVERGEIPAAAGRVGTDGKTYSSAGLPRESRGRTEPVGTEVDELLTLLTRLVLEVIAGTHAEGFEAAYKTAGANARGLFQTSAIKLAMRADRLRRR